MRFGSIFGGKEGGFAPGTPEEYKAPTDMGNSDDPRWRQSVEKYKTVDDVADTSDNPEEALMRKRGELGEDEDMFDDYAPVKKKEEEEEEEGGNVNNVNKDAVEYDELAEHVDNAVMRQEANAIKHGKSHGTVSRVARRGPKTPKYKTETKRAA